MSAVSTIIQKKEKQYWTIVLDDSFQFVDELVDFLTQHMGIPDTDPIWSSDLMRWKHGQDNPAGLGCIVIAIDGKKIVASLTLALHPLWIKGKYIVGGEFGDLYILPEYRLFSGFAKNLYHSTNNPNHILNRFLFARLAAEAQNYGSKVGVKIFYGTPNADAYTLWIANQKHKDIEALSVYRMVLPMSQILVSKYKYLHCLSTLLYMCDRLLLFFISGIGKREKVTISTFAYDREEVNALWHRSRDDYGFCVVRDADWVKYRYVDHPLAHYSLWAIRKEKELIGLIVLRKTKVSKGRITIVVIDWMIDRKYRLYTPWLIYKALRRCNIKGVSIITGWFGGSLWFVKRLQNRGWIKRDRQAFTAYSQSASIISELSSLPKCNYPIGFSDNG